jgi:hypothetical protein
MKILKITGLWVLLGLALVSCGPAEDESFERVALDAVEDRSESLANDLIALALLAGDRQLEQMQSHFSDLVDTAGLPAGPAALEPEVKWLSRHGWESSTDTEQQLSAAEMVTRLDLILDHFSELEDVRLKLKASEFNLDELPVQGQAKVRVSIVGRDGEGRREWLKAWAHVEATQLAEGNWAIHHFSLDSLESMLTGTDLFSEVALPAGLSATFPPFGVGANSGFVSHGGAVADVNGDGLLDLASTGVERNYLYLNRGDGRFDDLSAESFVGLAPPGSGALFLDYDNDGDPDLFLANVGNQMLLENRWIPDGTVTFWDVSEEAGVSVGAVGFTAVAADVNNDGLTDIYVASYNRYGTVLPDSWGRALNGTPNLLFLNLGDGHFQEAGAAWGVDDGRWSYTAAFVDLDRDGDQDLYVANDFGENAYYRNDGDGFSEQASALGIVDPGFGMGISLGDYDNDGDLDLHVTNMSSSAGKRILKRIYSEEAGQEEGLAKLAAGNSLYENQGDGTFVDVSADVGNFTAGWAFGGGFIDLDNDGYEDLYSPNGFISGKSMKDT